MTRHIIPLPSWSVAWRIIHAYVPCRAIDRVLPGSLGTTRALLQEGFRDHAIRCHRRGGAGFDCECTEHTNGPVLSLGLEVDMIRTVTLPHLHLFGVTDGLELQIKKRGAAPLGGGQVVFKCPVVRQLKTLQFSDKGKIKKIRGVA
jgi:hypothetical protein